MHFPERKAFTLIELLIVIAIITILSLVVIFTLNPVELLRASRDSTRISDMSSLQGAINLYSTDQANVVGFSLGTSNVTYISLPDPTATTTAGTDCSGLGFPSGGSFHCAASSTFRNVDGTGWIPLNLKVLPTGSPLSRLPVDPTNTTSSNEYYTYQTDGATYKVRSVPESQKYIAQAGTNPNLFTAGTNLALGGGTGWIVVPGNTLFGTQNFYVMKYDAVCSDGEGNYLNDYPSTEQVYPNSNKPCTPSNGRQIASLAGGWPIGYISEPTAATYCQSIGAHLLTNNEWQTIAWNVENVPSNWSGNAVGSGYIYSGHNDSLPYNVLPADTSDANGYSGETNIGGSQRRTLTLSNGGVIWDMGGNIYQWTSNTIQGNQEPNAGPSGVMFIEYPTITTWGSLTQQTVSAMNATWNSSKGIGEIYAQGSATDTNTYAILRGSWWGTGIGSGIEAMGLNITQAYAGSGYISFRCAR